jgi:hypothetical protein
MTREDRRSESTAPLRAATNPLARTPHWTDLCAAPTGGSPPTKEVRPGPAQRSPAVLDNRSWRSRRFIPTRYGLPGLTDVEPT